MMPAGSPPEVPNAPRIILIANKAENTFIGPYLNDCYELGVGDPAGPPKSVQAEAAASGFQRSSGDLSP